MNTGNLTASLTGKTRVTYGTLMETGSFTEIPEGGRVSQDAVASSHDSLLLNEAFHTAQNAPDVRSEKVETLKRQIMNNLYNIDTRKLAAALLREEPRLFDF